MKQITKFKRLLSGVLSAVMAVSAVPIVSAHAEESTEPYPYTMFAASSDDGAITVNAGNFCVNGNVATNGTIVSSGNMNINGTRTEHANESMLYVLKKLNYSYFSGENVETYTENYVLEDLNININNPIDVDGTIELTGNINLNSGIKAVDDVTINGEVKNSNNAVICSETGDINIETSNVSFNGLIYAPYGDIVIDSDNLNLNNVVIIGQTITIDCPNVNANYSSSMAELIGNQSDVDVELYAMGSYNADVNAIDIEWFTNYTNSSYEVLYSDDNENYTSVATVTDATTYQYLITEDFQKRYFKISLVTNYGEVIESIPFVATKSEDGYEVDFLDSDDDGLPDIYEIMIGTDVNLPDTDSDTLTDYQEIYITGTDPTIYDSVVAGISDADADSDEDGLSNSVEITMGTNPQKADTDDDGLNDSEEGTYNTDPLNPDSDGDTLPDGDEPHIGLDPTNPETFDVPDNSENAIHDNDKYHKKFAENIRSIIPEISKEQADENITVTQITDQDYYDNIYTYNYSVPLDELIDQLSAEAHLWHSISTTGVSEYILFYSKVNHGKDWDVKVKSSWEKTIPNIKYYSQKFPFVFNDKVMNSENLGNFIYGCTGRACGFDMITLKIGSGYAGFTGNSPDDMTDIFFIQSGFDYFETVKSRNNW